MPIHFDHARDYLKQFDFQKLFIEELGWSRPARKTPLEITVKDAPFTCRHVAQLAGVVVLEVESAAGPIPDAKTRAVVHKELAKQYHENLLIFVDAERAQSLWYWVKRQNGKTFARDHLYVKGQPGDLFLSKLGQIVFDLADFDEQGNVDVVEVAGRLRKALDVEKVTKRFYGEFQEQHLAFLELIRGVRDDRQRRWYASVLLNRLMFIYFLQKKGFLDGGNLDYLKNKLDQSKRRGRDQFFSGFLKLLFFEGFAKPEGKRTAEARQQLGTIKYLNGGLFLPHHVEQENPKLDVPDRAFENLFALFEKYSWNLNDTPGGNDNEINPDVLGYIFEKYINQKAFGAYYTRTEITEYLCERTIHRLILDAVNTPDSVAKNPPPGVKVRRYESLADLLMDLDAPLCRILLNDVLKNLSLLDPACGSGAFLVAAMKTLINVYSAVIGKIKFLADKSLSAWLAAIEREHNVNYFIKKSIITDNLYGVDIMEEATEIARLRLFLTLVAAAETVDQLEPLPNIDFSILPGNSLIGLMRVEATDFDKLKQKNLLRKSYREILLEKNRLIDGYRHAAAYADDLTALRDNIEQKKRDALDTLDDILLAEFNNLGIKFEQATWDEKKKAPGKSEKRPLKMADIDALHPFHWGFEFDEIVNERGGFDAIITNPPWEIFKPNGKEFFEDHSELVTKKNMSIHAFEKEQARLLRDADVRAAWLKYLNQFPVQSAYFRSAPHFRNQISVVNGKKAGTDINLYKLFLEQCFNLLRPGGRCGIITPGGISSDLGTKQLREMLLSHARLEVLFCLSNERYIFGGVEHRQELCLLAFEKGGVTDAVTAAFRINPREAISPDQLDEFLHHGDHVCIPVGLIRRLSPGSLSVPKFKCKLDQTIAEKAAAFPLLGTPIPDSWNVRLQSEFHMTNDSHLFHEERTAGMRPLYEGKMIHQFNHSFQSAHYWLDEVESRSAILGRSADTHQKLDYEDFRLGFRKVARNSDERTMIATIIPPNFHAENFQSVRVFDVRGARMINRDAMLYLCGALNSFALDYFLRSWVAANINFFYVYQLPVPRLTEADVAFAPVARRVAMLICTTAEFDGLAMEVGLKNHKQGVTDAARRAQLRAELDGLVAHLYGLTEAEFAHILSTFPLVPDPVKVAAQNAYRDAERGLIK